jgi:hypothetical protein
VLLSTTLIARAVDLRIEPGSSELAASAQKPPLCDRHHTQLVTALTLSGMNLWWSYRNAAFPPRLGAIACNICPLYDICAT